MIERAGRSDLHWAPVHVASHAARGPEKLFLDWIVSHAEHWDARFGERDCHNE